MPRFKVEITKTIYETFLVEAPDRKYAKFWAADQRFPGVTLLDILEDDSETEVIVEEEKTE